MILFDGDDRIFKNILKNTKSYFEFGCGASTLWVLENTSANITCVDSDQAWLNTIPNDKRLIKTHINIGPLKDWGFPIDDSMKHNWHNYYQAFNGNADVVLIDGRFRVSCFLDVLNKAKSGTVIIFDDYTNREYYHEVETCIKVNKICGRQAIFIKSSEVAPKELINKYIYDER